MDQRVYNYVKQIVDIYKLAEKKCLDIGSFNVNGCVRDLFRDYTGLDMRQGPNVDCVANSHKIPYPDHAFEVVTCLEMLEHDDQPFQTMTEIRRILKPQGFAILTAPGIGFARHDYPSDYWRFTTDGLRVLLTGFDMVTVVSDEARVYGDGRKPT